MTTESKLVPVELLRNIEMTWREASAFSNTANNLIERGLPELRALLAAPVTRQYYYQVTGCKAFSTTDSDCICWHDEGTGPLFNNPMTTVQPSSWRDKPQTELDVLRQDLATAKRNEHNSEVAYKAAIERQDELRADLTSANADKEAYAQNAIDLRKRLTAAEQRNADLEKNAARYIWLRDKSESVHPFYLSTPIWFTGVKFNQESVDSTIDAAMTNPTEPKVCIECEQPYCHGVCVERGDDKEPRE